MINIKISYFYQIRNFPDNMIPISTAISDPAWYHDFTFNNNYQFKDKRGVWNGIRAEVFNPSKIKSNHVICYPGCPDKGKGECELKQKYKEYLDTLDFNEIIQRFKNLNNQIQKKENTDTDYTFVLMVYETPRNPCSERLPLIQWFKEHGYILNEFQKEN